MTIRTLHEIPTELPAARTFLDDIEELRAIFVGIETERIVNANEREVEYQIGGRVCDSVEDLRLKKMGRNTSTTLRLYVRQSSKRVSSPMFLRWKRNFTSEIKSARRFRNCQKSENARATLKCD